MGPSAPSASSNSRVSAQRLQEDDERKVEEPSRSDTASEYGLLSHLIAGSSCEGKRSKEAGSSRVL